MPRLIVIDTTTDICIRKKCQQPIHNTVKNLCKDHCISGRICLDRNCGKQPVYNYEGQNKGIYCKEHKEDGMVKVHIRWSIERFLEQARVIHHDKYTYPNITIINGKDHRIEVNCTICSYNWMTSVSNHINHKSGCPSCANRVPHTRESFISKATTVHGTKYDYSLISESDIKNARSKIQIKCNTCGYIWPTNINKHLNGRGCGRCAGNLPYTLGDFLHRARDIHNDKYDYSSIVGSDIDGAKSHVKIKCKVCGYEWSTSISSHINNKTGCPDCSNVAPITLKRLLDNSYQVHGDKYDYSLITENDIDNVRSYVSILCKTCDNIWKCRINNHIYGGHGCPTCILSKGELVCAKYLEELDIKYEPQYRIGSLGMKRFDFFFEYNGIKYVLEYDGIQHFNLRDHFDKTDEDFNDRQQVDILKTKTALDEGYNVIRIDYTNFDHILYHIESALASDDKLYLSNPNMYCYITDNIN